jgi:hypothetical protein
MFFICHAIAYITKGTNLKLKTRPKQLLGSLPLAFALPALMQSLRLRWLLTWVKHHSFQLTSKFTHYILAGVNVYSINGTLFCTLNEFFKSFKATHSFATVSWDPSATGWLPLAEFRVGLNPGIELSVPNLLDLRIDPWVLWLNSSSFVKIRRMPSNLGSAPTLSSEKSRSKNEFAILPLWRGTYMLFDFFNSESFIIN